MCFSEVSRPSGNLLGTCEETNMQQLLVPSLSTAATKFSTTTLESYQSAWMPEESTNAVTRLLHNTAAQHHESPTIQKTDLARDNKFFCVLDSVHTIYNNFRVTASPWRFGYVWEPVNAATQPKQLIMFLLLILDLLFSRYCLVRSVDFAWGLWLGISSNCW